MHAIRRGDTDNTSTPPAGAWPPARASDTSLIVDEAQPLAAPRDGEAVLSAPVSTAPWSTRRAAPVLDAFPATGPLTAAPAAASAVAASHVTAPAVEAIGFPVSEELRDRLLQRLLEILPGAAALLLITSLIWGTFLLPLPLAFMLLAFDVYWAWRSVNIGIHIVRGHATLKREAKVDWRQRYEEAKAAGNAYLRWEDVHHVVIIPSYKESVEKLAVTLETLASQSVGGKQLFVVLALEGAEEGAVDKALVLEEKFAGRFGLFFPTFHPPDIIGEVRGKSSNEAWAARHAKRKLVDEMGYDIDNLTITSCDADTQFPVNYYACLTCKFATHPQRYRRFWQAPIFLYNNIWEVPAPLRLPNALGSLNHLVRLTRKYVVRFPQSTYSLSMRMAYEVGYWDVDVIPEDWHMFLKCFFQLRGEVDVEPIYLPVGNDGVRSQGYIKTFFAHYEQARRHCWGAIDISYAIRNSFTHPEIPLLTRVRRTWSVFENHVLWSSQWFLITIGRLVPAMVAVFFGMDAVPEWFSPLSARILFPCIVPLAVMAGFDTFMRPPRPPHFPLWLLPLQYAQWFLMAVITFFFSALPALDAQIRLMLGKRLEYKVTEKA